MKTNLDFGYASKWAKFNLKYLVGVWPDKKNSGVLQIYRGPINGLLIIFIVLIPRFMALSFYWDNIDVVIYSTTTNITFIMAVLKITVLYLKKEVFVKFLDSMVSDWNNSMTKNEKNLMIESAIKSHNISITSTILTYLSCLLATIVQTWYNLESKQIIDPDPRLTTNLIWVVFLLYDTSSRINFIVTWLLQLYASAIGAVVYVSFDTLIIIIVLHICAQLKIIQLRIKKLYDNEYSKNIDITMKLIENVKKHIQLNRFAKKCENCCNIVLLLQLITWYFTFCFQGYALVESQAVSDYMYYSKWYNQPVKNVQITTIVMCGAKKSLKLTAGKFLVMSHPLFLDVIKTSLGFLSVLLAMKNGES
ncbi:uncharacterized protein LOC122851074 [Aphidius gifuensis]|uniref:uncharacterized protein LOC122851074 n=1 Tax=Aphidius gifuensis TaxID=684658 RepID=UPI001CDC7D43|nr:uncharacterized protein LOC122851074 [Aphidius gifuensis]